MKEPIIDVKIEASTPALAKLGVSRDEFADALEFALASLQGKRPHELPRATEIPLVIRGNERRLGEMAAIRVTLGCQSLVDLETSSQALSAMA